MRVHSILFLAVVAASGAAAAGSIVIATPSATQPSVMRPPERSGNNSFVAPAATVSAPSVIVWPDAPPPATPSIIVIGKPSAGEASAAAGDGEPEIVKVVRGGEAGGPIPEPDAPVAQQETPLLDPNDRGTPAKRNALRRQEERLAREAAEAAQQPPSP
jgi:hypothetical protein